MSIEKKVLFIEPFYGGSHKVLIDTLTNNIHPDLYSVVTLLAKKWHWRARCGALVLSNLLPAVEGIDVLFCSSVLNLTELLGLHPDLQKLKKIVYFHENQLVYPVQKIKERDVQYAYNQIITSLTADVVLFNSEYNKTSFLNNIKKVLKLIPDHRPKGIREKIESKSKVLYFPMEFPLNVILTRDNSCLHIVWPHRWEFDKYPHDFFITLLRMKKEHLSFKVSVLGESFTKNPGVFEEIRHVLSNEIVHFGYIDNKQDYLNVLGSCHVVVSTAKHEFFGVSMMEATYCGCYPLAPNDLVYPEIYPTCCLYSDLDDLYKKIEEFCTNPNLALELRDKLDINFLKYSKDTVLPEYMNILGLTNQK